MSLLPLKELSDSAARGVRVVFSDIDDTISTEGRVEAAAYDAVWRLHDAGLAVVLVTGRPAGWCDHLARMWPVDGVIGENGAFYFRYDPKARRLERRFLLSERERANLQKELAALGERILREVPGSALASDQPYRIHDLAVDYCEDVPALPPAAVDRIVAAFTRAGATAKVSSIHVNGWFGDYDKLGMMRLFAREVLEIDLTDPKQRRRAIYVGDSPNDEPAFAAFELAVGVANVRAFADRLRHPPRYVTRSPAGRGFAELAKRLVAARAKRRG